jgi:excisionase family DNA binding protein
LSKPAAGPGQANSSAFISRAQVCDMLGISTPTLHKWIGEGRLIAYHIGGRTLFRPDEVISAVKPVNVHVNTGKEAL